MSRTYQKLTSNPETSLAVSSPQEALISAFRRQEDAKSYLGTRSVGLKNENKFEV